MNALEVRYTTLRDGFTLFGVLFYLQLISFFLGLGDGSSLDLAESELEGSVLNQICGLVTLLVPLFFAIRHKVFASRQFYKSNCFLLVFLLALALSINGSYDPMLSFKRFMALISVVFFAGFIAYNYSLEKITFMLGCTIGIAALIGLICALIAPDVAFISGGIRDGAFKGIYPEKNAGARINAIGLLLLLPMIHQRNRWAIFCSIFPLFGILLAQSATGLVMVVAGTASYVYFLTLIHLRLNRSMTLFLGATFIYLLICLLLFSNYSLLLGLVGRDPSLTDRTLIWEILQPMIDAEFVTGYGFGAFWSSQSAMAFITRWGYIGNAHNGYVETMLNGGIIQLVALALMLAQVLIKQFRAVTLDPSATVRASALVIVGLFITTNAVAYVIPNYRGAEFLVFCTLALSFRHPHESCSSAAPQRLPLRRTGHVEP